MPIHFRGYFFEIAERKTELSGNGFIQEQKVGGAHPNARMKVIHQVSGKEGKLSIVVSSPKGKLILVPGVDNDKIIPATIRLGNTT